MLSESGGDTEAELSAMFPIPLIELRLLPHDEEYVASVSFDFLLQ